MIQLRSKNLNNFCKLRDFFHSVDFRLYVYFCLGRHTLTKNYIVPNFFALCLPFSLHNTNKMCFAASMAESKFSLAIIFIFVCINFDDKIYFGFISSLSRHVFFCCSRFVCRAICTLHIEHCHLCALCFSHFVEVLLVLSSLLVFAKPQFSDHPPHTHTSLAQVVSKNCK